MKLEYSKERHNFHQFMFKLIDKGKYSTSDFTTAEKLTFYQLRFRFHMAEIFIDYFDINNRYFTHKILFDTIKLNILILEEKHCR